METLGEALQKEMARVRELIVMYRDPVLKGSGNLSAAMMEMSLRRADAAAMSGDLAEMLRAYKDLKEYAS